MGAEINKYKAGGQYDKRISSEKKSEIVARSRKIIDSDQLSELSGVIDMLAEHGSNDEMSKYYILIDKLDERWVDDTIRFKLIRSLVESLRQFRRISNLKIVVALRSDVLERVVQETGDVGFQREKFEDYFVKIKWSQAQLKDLVNRRIDAMFRRQYSSAKSIKFEDVFQYHIDKKGAFEYMIDHTLMRPRDVISFINECLTASEERGSISNTTIRQAEREYSRKRRLALENEWRSAFPSLPTLMEFVAKLKRVTFSFQDVCSPPIVDDLALTLASKRVDFDPLFDISSKFIEGGKTNEDMMRDIIGVLYRVGVVGIKPDSRERFYYSHVDQPIFDLATVSLETKIRVHTTLHSSMGIDGIQDEKQIA